MSTTGTAIEWANVAHSVVRGCSPASAGCLHCYSARLDGTRLKRLETGYRYPHGDRETMADLVTLKRGKTANNYVYNGVVRLDPAALQKALNLPRVHKGKRGYSVFWNHRSDTFHEALSNEEIAAQFGVMAARQDLQFLVLTKRAKRMREWFELQGVAADVAAAAQAMGAKPCPATKVYPIGPGGEFGDRWFIPWPLPNVRLGVSAENQETADERVPELLATPAAGNFVSLEPMLGAIDVRRWLPALNWLIVGAESGPNARPAELDWVRSVRDQVLAARDGREVPEPGDPHLFVKQWDVCGDCTGTKLVRCECDGNGECGQCGGSGGVLCDCQYGDAGMGLAGKVRKGNPKLDGRSWAEVPR